MLPCPDVPAQSVLISSLDASALKLCNRLASLCSLCGRVESAPKHRCSLKQDCCYATFVCLVLLLLWESVCCLCDNGKIRALSVNARVFLTPSAAADFKPHRTCSFWCCSNAKKHNCETEESTNQKAQRQTRCFNSPSSFLSRRLPILFCLWFFLPLPVIRALWSGLRRWIRVGPAGSLTRGELGWVIRQGNKRKPSPSLMNCTPAVLLLVCRTFVLVVTMPIQRRLQQ